MTRREVDGKIRFTLGDLADAIERNGLTQIRGHLFEDRDGIWLDESKEVKIGAACAMGQAFINLGIDTHPSDVTYDEDNSEFETAYSNLEDEDNQEEREKRIQELEERVIDLEEAGGLV